MELYDKKLQYKIKIPKVTIIESTPFKNSKVNNVYYTKLLSLLEHNTNRLVMGDRYGDGFPIDKNMLRTYWNLSRANVDKVMSNMFSTGVLLRIRIKHNEIYYLNPMFAICGTRINKLIYDLFNFNGNESIGINDYDRLINEKPSLRLNKFVEVTYYGKT